MNQEILVSTIEGLGKRIGDLTIENALLEQQVKALTSQVEQMQQILEQQQGEQPEIDVVEE